MPSSFLSLKLALKLHPARRLSADTSACVINNFLLTHAISNEFFLNFRGLRRSAIMNLNDVGSLNAEICKLEKEISTLRIERKALFFIATCGISYAVLRFSPLAATILIIVSFAFCFMANIITGEH